MGLGDTLRLRPSAGAAAVPAVVAAVYESHADPATLMKRQFGVRFHLPDLERWTGYDQVDRIALALRDPGLADSLSDVLNRRAFGYRSYATRAVAAESSQTFRVVSRFHRAIGVITVVASAAFLLCVMLLKVEERRLDAAAMRLIGISRGTVLRTLWLEALAVAVVGAGSGVVLAWTAGLATNAYYQRLFDTPLVFSVITPQLVSFSVAVSLALGAVVGAVAAWRLALVPPLTLWRRT